MAVTYTSLLGLAKPTTGTEAGTWGDVVNDYLTTYLDAAVAGAQTISGSQTAVTLTVANGTALVQAAATSAGSAQYHIINCTGSPAATLVITAPSASRVYLVINATSTNQIVTVKGAATTGVNIPALTRSLIAWNGSDYILIASNRITDLTGTLTTGNGGTGLTTFTAANNAIYSTSSSALTAGTLPVAAGGTGATTLTGVVKASGVSAFTAGSVSLSTEVTGTLPIANGGTGSTTAANAATALGVGTASSTQLGSLGVGTTASGTTGEIRATNNVTAYYSSDRRLKENIRDIPRAVDAVEAIGGKLFDWTDKYIESKGGADGYFVQKSDFGVVAQDVQEAFPLAVREREDGTLAVDYEKLCALAFAAIKELSTRVKELEAR
jgi:hypothetical protein